MSEKFKKTYISAREFVSSWEKEVYELTHLDYFIYLLINELGSILENEFFNHVDKKELFYLNNEEISTLAFNIGDGLQLFLDKNCFGNCSLGCPNKLHKPFSKSDDQVRINFVTSEFDGLTASCTNREDCLYHDVMNYVVVDAVLDFYNYEMGVIMHEKDRKLNKLSTFIMDKIIQFTHAHGAKLLNNPSEIATDLFSKDLQNDDDSWDNSLASDDIDDDNSEIWKTQHIAVETVFADFQIEQAELLENEFAAKLFNYFQKFLEEYLEISTLNELEFEYIEEFFLILFPQDFLMDEAIDFAVFEDVFKRLFIFIDVRTGTGLTPLFDNFSKSDLPEVQRTLAITQEYQKKNTYLNFLLSEDASNPNLLEGYYEVKEFAKDYCLLYDVDLKTSHENIDLSNLAEMQIKQGDIIHLQLDTAKSIWKIGYLELIYPAIAKYYLY